MLNSNLLELLSKFTNAEFKEFQEFVSSPFFNKNKNVSGLFAYIKKYYPEFTNSKLEKEVVFRKLFPGESYNDGYVRTLMFKLQKLAEDYLSFLNYRNKEVRLRINLLQELNSRKLEKLFIKMFAEQEKEFEESAYKGYDYFHYKIELEQQKMLFENWRRFKNKDLRDYTDENFVNSIEYINSAYLIRVLSRYRFLLAKQKVENVHHEFGLLDSIVNYLDENAEYITNPVIDLHLGEILLLKTNDKQYYFKLKNMLINEREKLSLDERYSLLNILNQYALELNYKGNKEFKSERFDLYSIALREKIYKGENDQYFDEIMFGTIAMVAIRESKLEWAKAFVEEYKSQLPPSSRATVINFTMAQLSFAAKDYQDSLQHLSHIQSIKHIQFKTPVRDLTLMTYYELEMFTQAYFLADSYRHFLLKNKSYYSESRYERISNFLKYYLRLAKLKENPAKGEVFELQQDLAKTLNVLEKDWLIRKTEELEKQK